MISCRPTRISRAEVAADWGIGIAAIRWTARVSRTRWPFAERRPLSHFGAGSDAPFHQIRNAKRRRAFHISNAAHMPRPMTASLDSHELNFPGSGQSGGGASNPSGTDCYVYPVLDEDFPDPAVIRASDGYYYAYGTQTLRDGEWLNIQVTRSKDLVEWEHVGDALPKRPSWAQTTQDFWAPSVIFDGKTYFMYFSATPDVCHNHERGHALAVATSDSPTGPFTD